MLRPYVRWLTAGVVILAVAGAVSIFSANPKPALRLNQITYALEIVYTTAAQQKGLSGRAGLTANTGMLFRYDTSAERCFWMKGMKFNIDIIWADASRRVTRIEAGLSPNTYPQSYCAEAQYVIELNAGEAVRNGLKMGDKLDF